MPLSWWVLYRTRFGLRLRAVLVTGFLFGFLDALANFMQGRPCRGSALYRCKLFQALPYVLTCILLAEFIGVARPAALLI